LDVTKNSKTVAIGAIVAVVVMVVVFVARDLFLGRQKTVTCPDGSHPAIDIRDFTTQYWAYSAKLEGSVADKTKVSAELDPRVLAQLSDALQAAREFRKYVVAGYNSCAITPPQYEQLGTRFNALDGLAREINTLISNPSLSQDEKTKLAGLISQYSDLVRQLGSQ
jgi:hypothetical protein